jgi:type IV secretion system protein VirB4
VSIARAELSNAGFVSVKEDLAVTAAFYAQFPANWQYRTRLANVSSLNFLGLSPLHNFATGKKDRNPWGECITTLQTTNGQPYFFNFHATHPGENSLGEKVLGNTMVIGKSGTGKTALINFLLSQAQKLDPSPTIFFFDKDRGAEIFVRACGGNYLALENGIHTGFNPFHCENTEDNAHFLCGLIRMVAGKSSYTPREEDEISAAVNGTLDMPMHLRSMTSLRAHLPNTDDDSIYNRIKRWCGDGSLGWVFDNPRDTIDLDKANIIGFDYTDLIDNPEVRAPVISYLLHRLEALIDGRRLIYVMDEFWKILDGGGDLKDFAKNKQKTIRKQNGLGIFATQSPEDALSSDIAPALIEQTATMILLPNPSANREDYIDGLKLTEAEFKLVASMDERSRRFLIKQGHDSSMCLLDLNGMDDALAVISASTDNIEILHQILNEHAQAEEVEINDLRPEQWLQDFYDRRKGSGKSLKAPQQRPPARAQDAGASRARQTRQTRTAQHALAGGDDDDE